MRSVRSDLIVPLDGIDIEEMLEFWRWLLPPTHEPRFATALGDLFVSDPEDRILWLDMGVGRLQQVATDEAEFLRAVADPRNNDLWFGAALVDDLRKAGKILGRGECYCYLKLPMLGGEYEPDNFVICDILTHFQIWGPIHEKLRDLPDGTAVEFKIV